LTRREKGGYQGRGGGLEANFRKLAKKKDPKASKETDNTTGRQK